MSFLEIVLLAVGLSMDSLAVSVTGGALIQNYRHHHMLKIGCVMGIFQAGMTIAGYLAGMSFKKYITAFDRFPAVALPRRQNDIREYPGKGRGLPNEPAMLQDTVRIRHCNKHRCAGCRHIVGLHRISHCTGSLDDRDRHLPILRFWCLLRQPLQPQDRPQTGPDRRIDPDRHRHQNPDRASLFQWISHHFTFTSSQTTISQLFPVNPVNAPQGSSPLYKSKPAPPPSCLSIKTP